jgi:hypothetical protein
MSESEIRAAMTAAEHQAVTAGQHPVEVREAEASVTNVGYVAHMDRPRHDPAYPQ